jgi:hypothetical protein
VFPSDLPGFDPATLNGMILYYRLMTKQGANFAHTVQGGQTACLGR